MENEKILHFDFRLGAGCPYLFDYQVYERRRRMPGYDLHSAVHLIVILSGRYEVTIGERRFSRSAGEAFLVAPWEPHGDAVAHDGCALFSLILDPLLLERALHLLAGPLNLLFSMPPAPRMELLGRLPTGAELASYAQGLLAENPRLHWTPFAGVAPSAAEQQRHWLRIQGLFTEILAAVPAGIVPAGDARRRQQVQPALRLLASEEARPLTAARAARECHLSRGHFDVCFRRLFQMSFYAYELRYRLNRAAQELQGGGRSVKELAAHWGFADSAHFSRTFLRHFGVRPTRYAASGPGEAGPGKTVAGRR